MYLYRARMNFNRITHNKVIGQDLPPTAWSDCTRLAVVRDLRADGTAEFVRWGEDRDLGTMHEVERFSISNREWNGDPEPPKAPEWLLFPLEWKKTGPYQSGQWSSGHYYYSGISGWSIARPKRGTVFGPDFTIEGLTGTRQPIRGWGREVREYHWPLYWGLEQVEPTAEYAECQRRLERLANADARPITDAKGYHPTPGYGYYAGFERTERVTFEMAYTLYEAYKSEQSA